ncbi:MAG: glycine betaine ABC transporter substrate-binding protein [Burkholderiaceae bacterium]
MRLSRNALCSCVLLLVAVVAQAQTQPPDPLRIGGKRFTEAYILAEVLAQTARAAGTQVEVKAGLGNTAIVYAALRAGSIDIYPEYSGTIAAEIVKDPAATSLTALREKLQPLGLGVDVRLGFHNGYALAMRADVATRLGIGKLSDLARHPALRLGLSNEFIGRADGWPGLAQRYQLPQRPQGLDHGLAYDALAAEQIDVMDIYTTDAKIAQFKLRVLQDDVQHFPRYDAVLLYRLDVPRRFPQAWAALQALQGSIDEPAMIAMNARAEIEQAAFDVIARDHLARRHAAPPSGVPTQAPASPGFWPKLFGPDLARLTLQHLGLVLASVTLAVLIGVPLALAVASRPRLRAALLGATGALQTIPSLALLAVLISLMGRIGAGPALVALTLYALLPIVRNTCTGLAEVPRGLLLAAQALGLTRRQSLWLVELPLARPVLLAGVRTATTIAVGTATIAAFIGAGGYGERIVTGLALNDRDLLLAGAVPSAVLALLFEAAFGLLDGALRRRSGITGK